MILPGHIALAILGHTVLDLDLPATLAATLLPDAVDKSLAQVAHITPGGRYAMHSLAGWATSVAIAWLLGGRKWGRAWAIGHFLHFLGDRGGIPWWFPFKRYEFTPPPDLDDFILDVLRSPTGRRGLLIEFALLGLAMTTLLVKRRSTA